MSRKATLTQHNRLREHATTPVPKPPTDIAPMFEAKHHTIWDQYVTCRAPADWDAGDLRLLAQAVLLESGILDAIGELQSSGPTITGSTGKPSVNPSVSALQKFMQSQGSLLRRLGISVSGTVAPRDVRKNAELARKVGPNRSGEADEESPNANQLLA